MDLFRMAHLYRESNIILYCCFLPNIFHSSYCIFPFSQLTSRRFTEEMRVIANCIYEELLSVHNNDPSVVVAPINNLEVLTYYGKKGIRWHRDQVYNKDGSFQQSQNSQLKGTVTSILILFDNRELEMGLFKRGATSPLHKDTKMFLFEHGALFHLHPRDEEDQIRTIFKQTIQCFYKHRGKGVKKDSEFSVGFVFRSCAKQWRVCSETGKFIVDLTEGEKAKLRKKEEMVDDYMEGKRTKCGQTKKEFESFIQSLYRRAKDKYLSV